MNKHDKEAFESWYELPADQTLNDPKLYRQFLDDTLPDHTKTFCEKAWQAACEYKEKQFSLEKSRIREIEIEVYRKLEAERARNKKLRETLDDCLLYSSSCEDLIHGMKLIAKVAREALKEVEG